MIKKILIANRGEIACRIIKTCKRLNIATVAIYSDIDENAMFVKQADESYALKGISSEDTYLNIEKILDIANRANVDAIHPGYGFLSENAEFAQRLKDANFNFIGPESDAILQMGMKSTAKKIMQAAGVPVLPGYNDDDNSDDVLYSAAEKIGYPILIKAAAGGGGKGMRIVHDAQNLIPSIAAAKREAQKSFSNDKLIIEKFLESPRHIEVQIMSDKFGNGIYLFERDCSMQRRYQKIIEEAPAPNFDEKLRHKLGEAALQAASAINYCGAGTVEFLVDNNNFYFMEMNTRLQVEHPVTEMITNLDLVELQILVANDCKLPFNQNDLKIDGVAIEARLYAEDPQNNFLPACGTIKYLNIDELTEDPGFIRIDTGVETSDAVDIYYDPMLAKIIAKGKNREQARERLLQCLDNSYLIGLKNNINFLKACLKNKQFVKGIFSTNFIEEQYDSLLQKNSFLHPEILIAAAIYKNLYSKINHGFGNLQNDPWDLRHNFKINQAYSCSISLKLTNIDNQDIESEAGMNNISVIRIECIDYDKDNNIYSLNVTFNDDKYNLKQVSYDPIDKTINFNFNGLEKIKVLDIKDEVYILHKGHSYSVNYSSKNAKKDTIVNKGALNAPMPGTIVAVNVEQGSKVNAGDILIILEAMKMEHPIKAPREGTIANIHFTQGEQVAEGAELLIME